MKYLVCRVNRKDELSTRIHGSENDRFTLCGMDMDESMYIKENRDIDISKINCTKCKREIK